MASAQIISPSFILIFSLTLCGSRAIVPACFSRGASSGRVLCEDVDLTWVTAQDMTSAFKGTSGVSELVLRRCEVLPELDFLSSAITSNLKSLTLDDISLQKPLTIGPFIQFITNLELLTFTNMKDLETVDFMRLAAIKETWKSLRTFTVKNCSLLSLNPDLWRFLTKVEKLNFSHNNLSSFDFGTGGFGNLVELDASYNKISLLRNLQWDRLSSLERFFMTSNKLFDPTILSKLPNIVIEIRLDGNLFSEIILDIAARSDLQTLILSNNSLQTIRPSFFDSNRRNLETLELDGNRGLNISGLFGGLTKLKSLSLRFCYINEVGNQFQNLSSLEELDLAENWLENVPQSTFTGSSKLRHLNLRSNHLSTLDFLEAAGAPDMATLNSLDLTDNNLSILPSFIKAPNLGLLAIRGNSLDKLSGCDYKQALINLKSFCAPALQLDASCEYQSFIKAIQQSASRLKVYNDERCCSNPVPTNPACCMLSWATCSSDIINTDLLRKCPAHNMLCTATSPGSTNVVPVKNVVTTSRRKPFENLEDAEWIVAILGYMFALVILGFAIYFLCRKVSADKRRKLLRFERNVDHENRLDQSALHVSMSNDPSETRQNFRSKQLNSIEGSCSLESNYAAVGALNYPTPNTKPDSPNAFAFRGRPKFVDTKTSTKKLNRSTNQQSSKNVYIAQAQQQELASCSATESPIPLSDYSYATKPVINSAQHMDQQLLFAGLGNKYALDVVGGVSASHY